MRKIRVFVSQRMKGLSNDKIFETRDKIFNRFKNSVLKYCAEPAEVELIDSYIEEDPPEDVCIPVWYMGKSIEQLSTADVLIIDDKSTDSDGCCCELKVCDVYNIPHMVIKPISNRLINKRDIIKILDKITLFQGIKKYDKDIEDILGPNAPEYSLSARE